LFNIGVHSVPPPPPPSLPTTPPPVSANTVFEPVDKEMKAKVET
jgi:hypothetical protein